MTQSPEKNGGKGKIGVFIDRNKGRHLSIVNTTLQFSSMLAIGAVGLSFIGPYFEIGPGSPNEDLSELNMKLLWDQMVKDGFVHGTYEVEGQSASIKEFGLHSILAGHGFDAYRNGGTEHWEVIKKDGVVVDIVRAEDAQGFLNATGTGPVLIENTNLDPNEPNARWQLASSNYDRSISDADHDRASEYFKSHGFHLATKEDFDKIPADKLLKTVQAAHHYITQEELKSIILTNGGHFTLALDADHPERNVSYEIWVGPNGPELHQVSDSAGKSYVHIERGENGKSIVYRNPVSGEILTTKK